ncbi:hypothetical protein C7212DRAFT_356249 [Tuber magnatum]|uniref:SAP domain-containing protein n=1 Tax=Tuber magnatum TaxID=42249 RepID=A0A317SX34_9PEZI|nr:hypothetical protein C7212DRAFT_356249 [Tuber magnatum]
MLDPTTLPSLKVTELKAELRKRGLPVGGLKQALVERLTEQVLQERAAAAEAEAIATARAAAEGAAAKDERGEEVVNGDDGVIGRAPDPEAKLETEPVQTEVIGSASDPEAKLETEPVQTEVIGRAPDPEAKLETEPVQTEVIVRAPDPEAKLETESAETVVVERAIEEEPSELAPGPKAKFEDEVVEKANLEGVTTKTEVASDGTPGAGAPESGAIVERKEETSVGGQSVSQFEQEAEMERAKSEEPVIAAGEPVREMVDAEDSKMADVLPLSLPVEKDMAPGSAPVRDDIVAGSTSKPELETDLQQASTDPMDTSEERTDIRKRKRRSITPASPAARINEPENQQSNEGAIPKKPRRDSTENQPQRTRPKDARFKGLFNDSSSTAATNNPPVASHYYNQASDQATGQLAAQIEDEDDTPIPPSIHPATRALYIRNFARPLSEPALKAHLTALASAPSSASTAITSQPSESPIEYVYLDTIKTHALIIFTTLTAATRVRVGIHTKVWPNERSRKPLWADFVPEESVAGWVNREKQRGPGARWEVVYDREAGEGGVRAELEEVGGRRIGPGGGVGVEVLGAPTGPRGERRGAQIAEREFGARSTASNFAAATAGPTINNTTQRTTGGGRVVVKDLDQLFRSTTTKPKLYWMPVDPGISRERMAAYERGRGNGGNSGNAGAGSSRRRR